MRRSACVIISCLSGLPAVWSRKVHNTCYQNRHLASYSVLYTRFEDFKPCSYVSFIAIMGLHTNARCEVYPRADVKRFPVPDDKVDWAVKFPEYKPIDFTSKSVSSQPVWADNPNPS